VEFDLQAIWTTAGAATAVLIVGYVFGFLQSVAPFIPSTGNWRNIILSVICGGLVLAAAIGTGKTLEDPDAIQNIVGGAIVFLGLQRMAVAASDIGTQNAVSTAGGAPLEVKPPDATVASPNPGR